MRQDTKLYRSMLQALLCTSCLSLSHCIEEVELDEDVLEKQVQSKLATVPIGGGKEPGGDDPVPCSFEPPCASHCDMTLPNPGTAGWCCHDDARTTCGASGWYDGGRMDPDVDNDGVLNQDDNCWLTPNDQTNSDSDHHGDACDNCPLVANPHQYDMDNDGKGDLCDDDADGDGVSNEDDLCPFIANVVVDSDQDGLGDGCDNCPYVYNPDQINSDEDFRGDRCDNCPTVTNATQSDSDGDGRGDACPTTLNATSMRLDAPECSPNNYNLVDGCINRFAPPPPSIHRGISTAYPRLDASFSLGDSLADAVRLPVDTITTPRHGANGSQRTQITPAMRSTNDARLYISGGASSIHLTALSAEEGRIGDLPSPSGRPLLREANQWGFPSHILYNTQPGGSNIDLSSPNWGNADFSQVHLCDDSGSALIPGRGVSDETNPRSCERRLSNGAILQGSCYDVTFMVGANGSSLNEVSVPTWPWGRDILVAQGEARWELRSSDVTVFVGDPMTSDPHIDVFPRIQAGVLLEEHMKDTASDFAPKQSFSCDHIVATDDCNATCADPSCIAPGKSFWKWHGGRDQPYSMFEPVTTGDGRVLVLNMHDAIGLMYAVAPEGEACQADSFRLFKSLSCFPSDPRTQGYGLAQSAPTNTSGVKVFLDSRGNAITPGSRMIGAYPWIDREGRNIFFAQVIDYREGWRATSQTPAQDSRMAYTGYPDQHPSAAGNGVVALGAWTQGKVVVQDNLLNPTDFTGGSSAAWNNAIQNFTPYNFHMALYEGPDWTIRPSTSAQINSPEHHLHYIDAFSPLMPFDVVWRMATNTNHNVEVAFDEYMLNNAFVVAHMNAPHTRHGEKYYPQDGFVPSQPYESFRHGGNPDFKWRENPRLQNASTARASLAPFRHAPPRDLRVRGGARVEPVALGGVRGKGVYLDGVNDFIDMGFQNPNHRDWFHGIWLDWRDLDTHRVRTIYYWPDGSWVGASLHKIVAYNAAVPEFDRLRELPISGLERGEFFHLGTKVYDQPQDDERRMHLYINGAAVGPVMRWNWPTSTAQGSGFEMSASHVDGWTWFVVGDPGPAFVSPGWGQRTGFKGWIDEFRIYALSDTDPHSHGVHDTHLEEFVCNLALGTLTGAPGAETCEQLDVGCSMFDPSCTASHAQWPGRPSDFPLQSSHACVDRVHRNPGAQASSCRRADLLDLPALSAHSPRPDTRTNAFCLGCHRPNHTVPGLGMSALTSSTQEFGQGTTKLYDPRRQPMEGPAALGGCLPLASASDRLAMGSSTPCHTGIWPMDIWHELSGKYVP